MTSIVEHPEQSSLEHDVTFEEFCEEWLREFREGDLSPFDKGQQFAFKLVTQWLGVTEDDDDLVLCDGSGDGGIDIAYLHRADIDDSEQDGQSTEEDTWYLIQSKYGTAFQGPETVLNEGRKVISTLSGENTHLSDRVSQLLGRLNTFMQQASERDRISLVFATEQPMNESVWREYPPFRSCESAIQGAISAMFNQLAWGCSETPAVGRSAGLPGLERSRTRTPPGGCSDCPGPPAPPPPPGRLRPPASASDGRSPAWSAAGSCRQPASGSQPGTGCAPLGLDFYRTGKRCAMSGY